MDADKDLNAADPTADYLLSLQEGETYYLEDLQAQFGTSNFAVLCITDPAPFSTVPFEVGSVGLRDNNYRTHIGTAGSNPLGRDYNPEGSAPYTLGDDNAGDYNPTDFTLGEDWSITCQAFCDSGLQGEESVPVTRTFQMITSEQPNCSTCSSDCISIVGKSIGNPVNHLCVDFVTFNS